MAPGERFTDCTVAKGPKTLKDCPRRPAGSARPRPLRSRDIRPRFSSILCSSYACETARPEQSGHWRPANACSQSSWSSRDWPTEFPRASSRDWPTEFHRPGLGNDRWSFYRPRPGSWHDNPGLLRSVGQRQPVGLRQFVECKSRLHLALMLRVLSWRRSGLDRNRGATPIKQKRANHIVLDILIPTPLPFGSGCEPIFKTEFGRLGGK